MNHEIVKRLCVCENCNSNLKKCNHLIRLFLECKRLEVKLTCPYLHISMFNKLLSKLLILDKEAAELVHELNLEGMRKHFIDYLCSLPKYIELCKKERCECGRFKYLCDCP